MPPQTQHTRGRMSRRKLTCQRRLWGTLHAQQLCGRYWAAEGSAEIQGGGGTKILITSSFGRAPRPCSQLIRGSTVARLEGGTSKTFVFSTGSMLLRALDDACSLEEQSLCSAKQHSQGSRQLQVAQAPNRLHIREPSISDEYQVYSCSLRRFTIPLQSIRKTYSTIVRQSDGSAARYIHRRSEPELFLQMMHRIPVKLPDQRPDQCGCFVCFA